MSINYQWSISKIRVIPQQNGRTNIVNNVEWFCQGVDDQSKISAFASGEKTLELSDSFIPYEQLTEQQVLNWCFLPEKIEIKNFDGDVVQTIVKNMKEDAEQQIAKQIEQKIALQSIEPKLPWSN